MLKIKSQEWMLIKLTNNRNTIQWSNIFSAKEMYIRFASVNNPISKIKQRRKEWEPTTFA